MIGWGHVSKNNQQTIISEKGMFSYSRPLREVLRRRRILCDSTYNEGGFFVKVHFFEHI